MMTSSMGDVVLLVESLVTLALCAEEFDDDRKKEIEEHVAKMIDETDTPFLNDKTFDPFMKCMLPAIIDQTVEMCKKRQGGQEEQKQLRPCLVACRRCVISE